MLVSIVSVFILGYLAIALENKLKINKAGIALFMAVMLWAMYIMGACMLVPKLHPEEFALFLKANPATADLPLFRQCLQFIANVQIIENLGEISQTLFFLIGAMTIVELIDAHGGFAFITNRITAKNKQKVLWIITFITFFMSAVLDNMTTAIIMITLVSRLIRNYKERWIFAGIIIIAANGGGAWSPIGDVTTIMLWIKGNITSLAIIKSLFIPSLVSVLVPAYFASRLLHGVIVQNIKTGETLSFETERVLSKTERLSIFVLGVGCLVAVPILKAVVHLPPFMGILLGLGIMWIYTDYMYRKKSSVDRQYQRNVASVLKNVDTSTILFFLGILLSVAVLDVTGILSSFAGFLNEKVHNVYIINLLIGLLSAVVDNVPLVAAAIGMYPVADPAMIAASADPAFMEYFVRDGVFWHFLAYCAGVGGSILIIGSAAGIVVMGIERIHFAWYLKNISLMALSGYFAGAAAFALQVWIVNGAL